MHWKHLTNAVMLLSQHPTQMANIGVVAEHQTKVVMAGVS
jgi:hypothetical protein